ncbi:MAG TPA: nicotinate-nucleotide adenylyltransferase [Verrucomicrobiota bacterium]|nr:nicotinate-nucleotide adenylyltransferase [Verrucomicrobiota bacterium]
MNNTIKRLGLFGGSFNPIHNGHLLIARMALEKLNLDRIFFIPASKSPFKPELELAPEKERLKLLRLALAGETKFEIDEQEINRKGISYTIDTVRNYTKKFPDYQLFYIIGADHANILPKWKSANELAKLIEFAIFSRPGENNLEIPPPFKGMVIKGFSFSASSTIIRDRIKNNLPIKWLVAEAVAEAINNSKLYQ